MQKSKRVVDVILGKPQVYLGRGGINENVLDSIRKYLKKGGAVKVRVMKSFQVLRAVDTEVIAHDIAELVNGEVIDVRGLTFVIVRRRGSAAGGT